MKTPKTIRPASIASATELGVQRRNIFQAETRALARHQSG
jgi:hypothetical protein